MREIKFRAWDTQQNKMLQWEDLEAGSFYWLVHTRYIPLQFTGLKDKNGKEIYEGDIVDCKGERAEVEWKDWNYNYGWHFTTSDRYLWETDGLSNPWEEVEIIGNSYENLELLTKSNDRNGPNPIRLN